MTRPRSGYGAFRARYVVAVWVLTAMFVPGFDAIIDAVPIAWTQVSVEIARLYYGNALFAAALALAMWIWRCPIAPFFRRQPSRQDFVAGIELTAFVFLFSIAAAFAVFYPLSFLAPDYVQWWYLDAPDLILYDEIRLEYPFWPNVFSALSLCIVAPILEEIAFRGALLHRWTAKWGVKPAILISSAFFAMLHGDPLGAFAFGIAMSILYLRSQSLLLPIVCHALNNFVVLLIEIGYTVADDPLAPYTIEEFRSEWYIGALAGLVCLWWAHRFLRRDRPDVRWELPAA